MIFERVRPGPPLLGVVGEVEPVVRALSPATPDGETPVRGRDLYLRVLTYDIVPREDGVLEAHRAYADVQFVLAGSERIAVWPADALRERTPYDAERDAVHFVPLARDQLVLTLEPGPLRFSFPVTRICPSCQLASPAL